MHSPTQPQIIKKAFSSPLRPIPLHSHSVSSSTPRWQEALQVDIELSALWSYVCRTERRRVRNAEILLARVNFHLKLQNKSRFSAILQLLSYRKHQGNLKKSIEKNLHPSHLNKHPPPINLNTVTLGVTVWWLSWSFTTTLTYQETNVNVEVLTAVKSEF